MSRKKESGVLIENRRAHFEYFLSDFMTAGLVLTGTEIKSLRAKNATISDAYIFVKHGEAFVCNMHMSHGYAKMEIALAKGKQLHDKRDSLKEKDLEREFDKNARSSKDYEDF